MRRLATQSRGHVYASMRDYQELHVAQGVAFHPTGAGSHRLRFGAHATASANSNYVGAGLYVYPSTPVQLDLTLKADGEQTTITRQLGGKSWNRLGIAISAPRATDFEVQLSCAGAVDLSVWGLSVGPLELPPVLLSPNVGIDGLNKTHLAPETVSLSTTPTLALVFDRWAGYDRSARLPKIVSGQGYRSRIRTDRGGQVGKAAKLGQPDTI